MSSLDLLNQPDHFQKSRGTWSSFPYACYVSYNSIGFLLSFQEGDKIMIDVEGHMNLLICYYLVNQSDIIIPPTFTSLN